MPPGARPKSRRLEIGAAVLLLLALGLVVWGGFSLWERRQRATAELARLLSSHEATPERIRGVLREGADVRVRDPDGGHLLHLAAQLGDEELIQRGLSAGLPVDTPNRYGFTPLLNAAIAGSAPVVRKLAAAGADVNSTPNHGISALSFAARDDRNEAVRALLECGARVDARKGGNNHQTTALMYAAFCGNPEAVSDLLRAGADPKLRDDQGKTALNLLDERLAAWDVQLRFYSPAEQAAYRRSGRAKLQEQIRQIRRLLLASRSE